MGRKRISFSLKKDTSDCICLKVFWTQWEFVKNLSQPGQSFSQNYSRNSRIFTRGRDSEKLKNFFQLRQNKLFSSSDNFPFIPFDNSLTLCQRFCMTIVTENQDIVNSRTRKKDTCNMKIKTGHFEILLGLQRCLLFLFQNKESFSNNIRRQGPV